MLNNKPAVSVIIPVYNGAATIEFCISSLMNQDYPSEDFEVIVVDNNSSDNTKEVVLKMATMHAQRVRYVLESNQGVSYARNRGIKESKGDYLLFTDDDCYADKNWIKEVMAAFKSTHAGAIQGKIILDSKSIGESPYPHKFIQQRMAGVDYAEESFQMKEEDLVGANIAFKREVFVKHGVFNPSKQFYLCEDTELSKRMHRLGVTRYYEPKAIVEHRFAADRLNQKSLLKQSYYWGRANIILEPSEISKVKYVIYCMKMLAVNWSKYVARLLSGNKVEAFMYKCKVYSYWGRCSELMFGGGYQQ